MGISNLKDDLVHSTDKLRELILKHPDWPILVSVDGDSHDDQYMSTVCSRVTAEEGEVLDLYPTPYGDGDYVCSDRDEFEERIMNWFADMDPSKKDLSDEEFDRAVKEEAAKYDKDWKPCIIVHATN